MNELVYLAPNTQEPFTTSEVIAECAGVKRHAIQVLIQKHEKDFQEFGKVSFEMRPLAGSKKKPPAWSDRSREARKIYIVPGASIARPGRKGKGKT